MRAATALGVIVTLLGAGNFADYADNSSHCVMPKSVVSHTICSKDILVSNPPKYVESRSSSFQLIYFRIGQHGMPPICGSAPARGYRKHAVAGRVCESLSLSPEDDQLQKPDEHQAASEISKPPIGRRFLVALGLVGSGTFLVLRGNTILGLIAAAGGFGVWVLTGFPWSWGWFL